VAVPFKKGRREPANVWAPAQTVLLDQVAQRSTARLVAKWKDPLAGADTFSIDTVSAPQSYRLSNGGHHKISAGVSEVSR